MFDELITKLTYILVQLEEKGYTELAKELEAIILSIKESKCNNNMFCGMDRKF